MSSLTNYRGLQVFPSDAPPPGVGGLAISDNFTYLVDWHPLSQWAQSSNPTASNDNTQNYFPGSLWLNSSTNELFLCMSSATGAAVWEQVILASQANEPNGYLGLNAQGQAVGTLIGWTGTAAQAAAKVFALGEQGMTSNTVQPLMGDGVTAGGLPVVRINSNGSITVPDVPGTVAGNARGKLAVDLQAERRSATQVASGTYSSIGSGHYNTAMGLCSFIGSGFENTANSSYSSVANGRSNVASNYYSFIGSGNYNTGNNYYSFIGNGFSNTASGTYSVVVGGKYNISSGAYAAIAGGYNVAASGTFSFGAGLGVVGPHTGEFFHGGFGGVGQTSSLTFVRATIDATQAELTANHLAPNTYALGATPNTNRFLLEEKTYGCTVTICARQSGGSNVAMYQRQFYVSQDTGGTVTLSTVNTIGTDNATAGFSSLAVSIAIDTTAKALQILVTGLAATTINWVATVQATIVNVN